MLVRIDMTGEGRDVLIGGGGVRTPVSQWRLGVGAAEWAAGRVSDSSESGVSGCLS